MRSLKIASRPLPEALSQELETLTAEAKTKQLPEDAQEALLQRIRNGDGTAISLLVDSWQIFVISIVRQYLLHENVNVAELVAAGQAALTRLAGNELNATGRERFPQFGVHHIHTAILTILQSRKEEKYEKPLDVNNGGMLSISETLTEQILF